MTITMQIDRSKRRCVSCGRVGTRGFLTVERAVHQPTGTVIGPLTVCAADRACQRRRTDDRSTSS
jgi:hypothetical protein